MKTTIRQVPYLIVLTFLLLSCTSDQQSSDQKPNVIVILADDLGWGDIGYNNPGNVYTPNLDRLAKNGVTFKHQVRRYRLTDVHGQVVKELLA